jgi:hypothetical protein
MRYALVTPAVLHKDMSVDDTPHGFPGLPGMIDDQSRIQVGMKTARGDQVTTVVVDQARCVYDPAHQELPRPDIASEGRGELLTLTVDDRRAAARS